MGEAAAAAESPTEAAARATAEADPAAADGRAPSGVVADGAVAAGGAAELGGSGSSSGSGGLGGSDYSGDSGGLSGLDDRSTSHLAIVSPPGPAGPQTTRHRPAAPPGGARRRDESGDPSPSADVVAKQGDASAASGRPIWAPTGRLSESAPIRTLLLGRSEEPTS